MGVRQCVLQEEAPIASLGKMFIGKQFALDHIDDDDGDDDDDVGDEASDHGDGNSDDNGDDDGDNDAGGDQMSNL